MEPESIAREFWFPVRERGAGLLGSRRPLVADGYGVYSLARRRYVRTSRHQRFRELAADVAPVVKAYRSLQKLGMENWPEYDEEVRREITLWKRKLMDVYWDATPDKRRASATERYLRVRYKHRMLYPFVACNGVVVAGGLAQRILGRNMPIFGLLLYILAIWFLVALTEILVSVRWILPRSVIYKVLEFEFTS
ncbi:hypothetical protein ACQJBY_023242 [Aegilops geniculata]